MTLCAAAALPAASFRTADADLVRTANAAAGPVLAAASETTPAASPPGTPGEVGRPTAVPSADSGDSAQPANAAPAASPHGEAPATGAPAADATTPGAAAATPPTGSDGNGRSPITVEADSLEVEKDGVKARASGNVIIEWDTTKLRAAEVRVDQRERRVEATGNVTYESDDIRATAQSVAIDVDDETGVLEHVELRLQGEPGHFGGSRLEKTRGRRVLLEDGYFTTCDTERGRPPDWELRGKHLDVRLDDYARMRGARLNIRGVPVLTLPYVIFPTKQTRQSGLLPFSLGTSTNRGFVFTLPGYWAIDKHRDLTMTAVVETSARLGLDGVYRYAPSRRRWGEVSASYYNESIRGDPKPDSPAIGVPEDRGSAELVHREYLGKWTGYADVMWVGDERFLREINSIQGSGPERDVRRTRRYTTSRVGAMTSRGFTSGGIDSTAYQDLIGESFDDGDTTTADPVRRDTQHKPLGAWLQTDRNLGPFAFALDTSLASFVRDKGAGGQRLDFASTVALPLLTSGPVLSRAWASGRGTVYAMTERNVLDEREEFVERLDTFPTRGIFSGGIDARTKFARDYDFTEWKRWSGLYHSLEPFAAMRYVARSSYDDIPLFDRLDAIDGRDVATYGIDSRFLLRHRPKPDKGTRAPLEVARLSLSQSYNLGQQVVDYDGDDNRGAEHLSDIDLAAFVQPVQGLALRTLTSYNVGAGEVRGSHASLSWETGPIGPLLRGPGSQIAGAYRYVRSDTADTVLQSAEMLARFGLTKNISLGLKGLYDIVGNKFVEKALGFTFTSSCDCWSVGLGVIDRVNPAGTGLTRSGRGADEELQVRFAFELKGLGGWGSGVTQRSSPALDDVEYDDVGFWRAGW